MIVGLQVLNVKFQQARRLETRVATREGQKTRRLEQKAGICSRPENENEINGLVRNRMIEMK